MAAPIRIAVWSGPRNISTALMRSWGNRPDTFVTDEPLYACYLAATGLDHPLRDEIIATYNSDWRQVTDWLGGPVPAGKTVWYQKHMAQHLLPEAGLEWLGRLQHVFLIRHPREVLLSYARKREAPTAADLGYHRQLQLFRHLASMGHTPPVLDARDILDNPEGLLRRLCVRLGLNFMDRMLHWPAGGRETDGLWAAHWYDSVSDSTGFRPYRQREEELGPGLETVLAACLEPYEALHARRLEVPVPTGD